MFSLRPPLYASSERKAKASQGAPRTQWEARGAILVVKLALTIVFLLSGCKTAAIRYNPSTLPPLYCGVVRTDRGMETICCADTGICRFVND